RRVPDRREPCPPHDRAGIRDVRRPVHDRHSAPGELGLAPPHRTGVDPGRAHRARADLVRGAGGRSRRVCAPGGRAAVPAGRRVSDERGGAIVYGANFSIGVNLFYQIVARSAALFHGLPGYDPFIEEAHHAAKRDAPSGTALALKDILLRGLGRSDVPLTSTRAGHIPGTHRVGFDSLGDQILLTHTARSRETFAAGALLAARWLAA